MPALGRATAPAFLRRQGERPSGPAGRHTIGTRLDPRCNSLNAIRLLLASTVILSHSWVVGDYGPPPRHGGATPGDWSVFAFFVLSGYLITGSRLNNSLGTYLKRRFLRIYPGFLVCLLATIAVFAPIGYYQQHHSLHGYLTKPNTPVDFLVSDLMLKMNVYKPAGTPSGPYSWTVPLWTLYFEFYCYVVVGLLACWAVFRRKPALAVAVFLLATVARVEYVHVAAYAHSYDVYQMVKLMPFFMAGSVFYLLRDRIPCNVWLAAASLAVFIVLPHLGPDPVRGAVRAADGLPAALPRRRSPGAPRTPQRHLLRHVHVRLRGRAVDAFRAPVLAHRLHGAVDPVHHPDRRGLLVPGRAPGDPVGPAADALGRQPGSRGQHSPRTERAAATCPDLTALL